MEVSEAETQATNFSSLYYLHRLIGISLNLVMKALYQTTDEGFYSSQEKPPIDENC